MSATDIGLNFRSTSGYVSDGADETYVLQTDLYPTTRAGWTFGWSVSGISHRDRNSGNDRRLAGTSFYSGGIGQYFRVDLPALGTYDIHAAFGDASAARSPNLELRDDTTSFKAISGSTGAANSFFDASGTVYTAANWPSNETAVSRVFSTTNFNVYRVASLFIAHLRIVQTAVAGGGSSGGLTTLGVG